MAHHDLHPLASYDLTNVLSRVANDGIGHLTRHGEVLVRYGNDLALKFRISQHNKQIRFDLRLAARVVIEARNINKSIEKYKNSCISIR